MKQKGQMNIIDTALIGIIAVIILSMLIGILWPLAQNFINMAENTPNFTLWSPMIGFMPAILFLVLIVWILRASTGQTQQRPI